jgi:UDP-N-acetylmuramoyl-tripeptide--D-alanyl-D-alanine ligase
MKTIFKKIIVFIITIEARFILRKYRPNIIAITGSVGKTSTKDAIASVLKNKYFVRKTTKSYNSEIGVPLVVLGCENAWFNPFLWLGNILTGLKLIFFKNDYPEWLVLELGVERPGDMSNLISWVRPTISVITALADIPVHVEYFSGPEDLMKEKAKILKGLGVDNHVILNADDFSVLSLGEHTKAKVTSYGFNQDADLLVSNYLILLREEALKTSGADGSDNLMPESGVKRSIPEGISFKVDFKGSSVPIRVFNAFGRHHVYPALAALAVGSTVGLNLVEMSESLSNYESPPGRLKLLEGEKNTFVLDDTYNSSPVANRAALDVLKDIPAKRKIAVLGDMLELGKYTIEAHKSIGDYAAEAADFVFTVGPRAKFIVEGLKDKGFNSKNIFTYSNSDDAKKDIEDFIQEDDLILIKGSQGMRMEKIVEEIMAHPENKEKLLVRQDKKWKSIK